MADHAAPDASEPGVCADKRDTRDSPRLATLNSDASSSPSTTGARTRSRPKKYQCPYCWVALSNTGQFKGHMRIHTGERPFECDHPNCNKTFTRNEELTRHKRIHTGQRPFACPTCNKCFGRKDHLKKHTKTHEKHDIYPVPMVAGAASDDAAAAAAASSAGPSPQNSQHATPPNETCFDASHLGALGCQSFNGASPGSPGSPGSLAPAAAAAAAAAAAVYHQMAPAELYAQHLAQLAAHFNYSSEMLALQQYQQQQNYLTQQQQLDLMYRLGGFLT